MLPWFLFTQQRKKNIRDIFMFFQNYVAFPSLKTKRSIKLTRTLMEIKNESVVLKFGGE